MRRLSISAMLGAGFCLASLSSLSIAAQDVPKPAAKHEPASDAGSDTTTAHQNTHLSMLLKRRDFADWDAIPWGILGSVALARR